jgi:hypothetical protein
MSEILDPVDTETTTDILDIVDLGDAVAETKEADPFPYTVDNTYAYAWA